MGGTDVTWPAATSYRSARTSTAPVSENVSSHGPGSHSTSTTASVHWLAPSATRTPVPTGRPKAPACSPSTTDDGAGYASVGVTGSERRGTALVVEGAVASRIAAVTLLA